MFVRSIGFKAIHEFGIDQQWACSAIAQARRAIEELDQKHFEAINKELGGEYTELDEYRQLLLSDIAAIEAALGHKRRDAASVAGGPGVVLLISGGLSTGDPPTELFASISRLQHAGLMPDARWPEEP